MHPHQTIWDAGTGQARPPQLWSGGRVGRLSGVLQPSHPTWGSEREPINLDAMSEITDPPLTCVDLSARDLGRESAKLLLDQVLHGARPGFSVQLPTSLVVRGSTGPRSGEYFGQ